MTQPTPETLLEKQLSEMRDAGLNVHKGIRTFSDQKNSVSKYNKRALEIWLPRWMQHAAMNYQKIKDAPSMGWLRSSAVGLPVIVVGIGPSLDQDLENLQRVATTNALVVATDAALRPLLANGIKPNLVITYDCKAEQYTLFEGLDEFTKDIVLLCNSCTHPNTLKHWAGPVLFYNMRHPGVEFMDTMLPCVYPTFGPLSNHGTVGNAAILVAYFMGADPIISLGMDLCYQEFEKGLRYRCRDYKWRPANAGYPGEWSQQENKVLYENSERLAESYDVKIKNQEFIVDESLEFYRKGVVELIGTMGNVKVVDCSQGGILGAFGVETSTLDRVIEQFCGKPIEAGQSVLLHLARLLPRLNNDAKGA